MRRRAQAPNFNFCSFLVGKWKRNLEWRHFGGSFEHLRTSNTIVVIEENVLGGSDGSASGSGGGGGGAPRSGSAQEARFLRWHFGKTLEAEDLRFGYEMKFIPDANGAQFMEWEYAGACVCDGVVVCGGRRPRVLEREVRSRSLLEARRTTRVAVKACSCILTTAAARSISESIIL